MNAKTIHVLLVEKDEGECANYEQQLAASGVADFQIERLPSGQVAVDRLSRDHIDVVLLHLSAREALEVLPQVQHRAPSVPVVVLGEEENESAAVEAVRQGAQDYLVRAKTDGHMLAHGLRYAIERKHAEEALQKSEAFYHSLVESLPQSIFQKDLLGRFTFGNRHFCAGVGCTLRDIVGKTDANFFPPELADKYRLDDLSVIESGKTFETIEQYVTPEGETLHVQVIKTPVHDANSRLIGTQGIFWDITERVRKEEQLRTACVALETKEDKLLQTMNALRQSHEELIQAQMQLIQVEKMESVGRLAAGVAHEVKNPLAILLMGVTFLADGSQRDREADLDVLRAMREAIGRADNIVRGLVDFSANRKLDSSPQDLNSLITRSLLLVKHELTGAHITAHIDLDPQLPEVALDPNRIQQVFVNLFMNAIQAMQPGGTLNVRTYRRIAAGSANEAESVAPGDTLVIAEVDDTGPGIPPDKLTKVFDPFFTTKPAGRGTGLGLTVVRKIIELHHGKVTIANRHEKPSSPAACTGARVTLTFNAQRSKTNDSK